MRDPLSISPEIFTETYDPVKKTTEYRKELTAEALRKQKEKSAIFDQLKLPGKWEDPKYDEILNKYNSLQDLGVEYLNKGWDPSDPYSGVNYGTTKNYNLAMQKVQKDIDDYGNIKNVYDSAVKTLMDDLDQEEDERIFNKEETEKNLMALRNSKSIEEARNIISSDLLVTADKFYSGKEMQDRIFKMVPDFVGEADKGKYTNINWDKGYLTDREWEIIDTDTVKKALTNFYTSDDKFKKSLPKMRENDPLNDPSMNDSEYLFEKFGNSFLKKEIRQQKRVIPEYASGRGSDKVITPEHTGEKVFTTNVKDEKLGKFVSKGERVNTYNINRKLEKNLTGRTQFEWVYDINDGKYRKVGAEDSPLMGDYEFGEIINTDFKYQRDPNKKQWKKTKGIDGWYVFATQDVGGETRDVLIDLNDLKGFYKSNGIDVETIMKKAKEPKGKGELNDL